MPRLVIKSKVDANRLRCPRGHSAVGPTNEHWHCVSCARHWGPKVDPEFERVRDAKTGLEYTRAEVELDPTVPGVGV